MSHTSTSVEASGSSADARHFLTFSYRQAYLRLVDGAMHNGGASKLQNFCHAPSERVTLLKAPQWVETCQDGAPFSLLLLVQLLAERAAL